MERTLIITGKGRISAKPDLIIMKFPVEANDTNYGEAVKSLNQLVELIRSTITNHGVKKDELKTTDFRVDTSTKWNEKTKTYDFKGFRAQHDLELEMPFDNEKTNKIISSITKLNIGVEFKISFGVKDKDAYQQKLIENAIDNAKANALTITKSTGVALREILNINFSFSEVLFRSDSSILYESASLSSYEDSMPDLNPADIKVDETVTITWRIE